MRHTRVNKSPFKHWKLWLQAHFRTKVDTQEVFPQIACLTAKEDDMVAGEKKEKKNNSIDCNMLGC